MHDVLAFVAVAAVLTVTPGATTALVLRSAMRGGPRVAVRTIAGNETGVLAWALLSVLGISALVAASQVAYDALRIAGAAVLVGLGTQALWRSRRARRGGPPPRRGVGDGAGEPLPERSRGAYRDGLLTSLANPKLSVFFVALMPQFVPAGAPVLPYTLAMAVTVVVLDFAWYLLLAAAVARAQRALRGALATWLERLTGTVLVGLGARLALQQR